MSKINYFTVLMSFLLLVFLFRPEVVDPINQNLLRFYSIIFIAATILHFVVENRKIRNWFRIDCFFLLGFIIVHFQWPIMFSFNNLVPDNLSRIWIDDKYVNFGTWLSTIGGLAWILGYSLINYPKISVGMTTVFNYRKLLLFSIFLFSFFLLTVGNWFLTGKIYQEGASNVHGGVSSYLQILFSISIIVLTAFVIFANRNKYQGNLFHWIIGLDRRFLFLVGVYIVLFLSVGDRGGPVALILALFILIGSLVRPINLKELLLSVIFGSLLMSIISLGRSDGSGNVLNSGLDKLEINSGYDLTLELANSVRTLYIATSEVPRNHDYFYGELWSGNLLSVVPFAQRIYVEITDVGDEYLGSAEYITYIVFGKNPKSGEGSTLIADIYLNLGVIGVVICMFLFGLFFKKVNIELFTCNKMSWIIVAAIVGGFSFYLGRSTLFVMLRPILWSIPLVYIFVKKYKI